MFNHPWIVELGINSKGFAYILGRIWIETLTLGERKKMVGRREIKRKKSWMNKKEEKKKMIRETRD